MGWGEVGGVAGVAGVAGVRWVGWLIGMVGLNSVDVDGVSTLLSLSHLFFSKALLHC